MIDIIAYFLGALTSGVSMFIGYNMGYHRSTNKKADIEILPRHEPKEETVNSTYGGKVEEDTPDIW